MDETTLQQEIQTLKEYAQNNEMTYEFYCKKADLLCIIGEYNYAILELKKALAFQKDYVPLWFKIGECYLAMDCLEYALLAFARSVQYLKQANKYNEAEDMIQAVEQIEGIDKKSLQFFHDILNLQHYNFVFISEEEYRMDPMIPEACMANALQELGCQVSYIQIVYNASSTKDQDTENGVCVYQISDQKTELLSLLYQLKQNSGEFVLCTSLNDNFFVLQEYYMKETIICFHKNSISLDCKDNLYSVYFAKANISFDTRVFLENYLIHNVYQSFYMHKGSFFKAPGEIKIETPYNQEDINILCVNVNREVLDKLISLSKNNPNYHFYICMNDLIENLTILPECFTIVERNSDLYNAMKKSCTLGIVCTEEDDNLNQIWEFILHKVPIITSDVNMLDIGYPFIYCAEDQYEMDMCIKTILRNKDQLKDNQYINFACRHSWLYNAIQLIRIVEDRVLEENMPYVVSDRIQKQIMQMHCTTENSQYINALCAITNDFTKFRQYALKHKGMDQGTAISSVVQSIKKYELLSQVYQILDYHQKVKDRKLILLVGYFGAGNFGDELLLSIMIQKLQQEDVDIIVVGEDPIGVWKRHKVPALSFKQTSAIEIAVKECNLIIIGPGGIIQDVICMEYYKTLFITGIYSYLFPVKLANLYKKSAVFVGVGAENITKRGARTFIFDTLKTAPLLWLRDENSKKCFVDMGLSHTKVYPDVSFLLDDQKLAQRTVERTTKTLGLNLRKLKLEEEKANEILKVVLAYVNLGWNVSFICADTEEDRDILHQMYQFVIKVKGKRAKSKLRFICSESNDTIIKEIAKVDYMIAMRLHIGLVAAQMGIPTIFISYLDKVASIAGQLGMQQYILQTEECSYDKLTKMMHDLIENQNEVKIMLAKRCTEVREIAQNAWKEVDKFLI